MSLLAPDPDWLRIQISDHEDHAWRELEERRDREREHWPAHPMTTGAPAGQGQGATHTEDQAP